MYIYVCMRVGIPRHLFEGERRRRPRIASFVAEEISSVVRLPVVELPGGIYTCYVS